MRPNLKIVPTSDIIPLMKYSDKKVSYLSDIITQTASIKNPLPLATLGKNRYLLLEDASLLEAIRQTRVKYVPAQVIRLRKSLKIYAELIVEDFDKQQVMGFHAIFPRTSLIAEKSNNVSLLDTHTLISFAQKKDESFGILLKKGGGGILSPLVFDFLDYLSQCFLIRGMICPTDLRTVNIRKLPDYWLMRIINISPSDIRFAGQHGYLFPCGSLRVEIGERFLGINYPVQILNDGESTRQKEQFLYDLVNVRLQSGFSEYIKSGVYLLNY